MTMSMTMAMTTAMAESVAEYAQRPLVISRIVVIAVVVQAHSAIPYTVYPNNCVGMWSSV